MRITQTYRVPLLNKLCKNKKHSGLHIDDETFNKKNLINNQTYKFLVFSLAYISLFHITVNWGLHVHFRPAQNKLT